jgi:hypothetical protein
MISNSVRKLADRFDRLLGECRDAFDPLSAVDQLAPRLPLHYIAWLVVRKREAVPRPDRGRRMDRVAVRVLLPGVRSGVRDD